MKNPAFTRLTRSVQVRQGFTEENVWRDALGGATPLHVFVTDGPLDAPQYSPAGSHRSCRLGGPTPTYTSWRDDQ